jgi:hypothetical protein
MHRSEAPGVAPAIIAVVLSMMLMLVLSVLLSGLPGWIRASLATLGAMEGTAWLLRRASGGPAPDLTWPSWRAAALCVLAGLGLSWFGSGALTLLAALPWDPEWLAFRQEQMRNLLSRRDAWALSTTLFSVVVMPAVFEERLFRGALLDQLRGRSFLARATGTALAFAVVHGDPLAALPLFGVGLVCAGLATRRWGWRASMLAHAALNGWTVLTFPWFGDQVLSMPMALVWVVVGGLTAGLATVGVRRLSAGNQSASVAG